MWGASGETPMPQPGRSLESWTQQGIAMFERIRPVVAAVACGLAIICASSSVQPVKATSAATRGDFTGDGKADYALYTRQTGLWSVAGKSPVGWGGAAFDPAAADYAGDGKADIALWYPSTGT